MKLPYIADEVFELMHEFSVFLLKDDKHDIGYYSYYNRKGHYYGNKENPHHPSMIHHWQLGFFGMVIAQLGGLMNMARNAMIDPETEIGDLYEESKLIDLDPSAVHEVGDNTLLESQDGSIQIAPTPSLPMPEQSGQLESYNPPVQLNLVPIPPLPDVKSFI